MAPTMLVLASALAALTAPEPGLTVHVRATGPDACLHDRAEDLRALIEAQLDVIAPAGSGDQQEIHIRLVPSEVSLWIRGQGRAPDRVPCESPELTMLEVSHRAGVLVLGQQEVGAPEDDASLQVTTVGLDRRARPRPRLGARLGADGGMIVRDVVDAGVRPYLRLGRDPGPGGGLEALFVPIHQAGLIALDTYLEPSFDWALRASDRIDLGFALGAGVRLHRFAQDGASAPLPTEQSGLWVDPAGHLSASLAVHLARHLDLTLAARVGTTAWGWKHVSFAGESWERRPWYGGLMVGFAGRWRQA